MAEDTGAAALRSAVDLVRLDRPGPQVERLRTAVLRLRVAPGQRGLVTEAVETLPRADADPDRTPFAVLVDAQPAGYGIIDRGGALAELSGIAADTARAVLLRAFYLAPEHQGRGIGRAACAALAPLVRSVHPHADAAFVIVGEANRAAVRAYRAGGFLPTGTRLTSATAGQQTVLRKEVA
ncbi:Acetyltransferase (GNAT) family protein [Streptomonospora litoralis]|uniref:Acetyltransferase (GNAT) family protein n=1 Tax=Streptomonospora litoralis TaxID=2498135 RepID=A0A4V0ZJE7_9ACTN|nr:GNAT family N-acetyltransferase [Streptomonospora litoralis]QBI53222.1 Acetyltransferase (GNAT) family protein [Streptomonospora litoralis]